MGGSVEGLQTTINWFSTLKGQNIQIFDGHGDPFQLYDYDLSIAKIKPTSNNARRIIKRYNLKRYSLECG